MCYVDVCCMSLSCRHTSKMISGKMNSTVAYSQLGVAQMHVRQMTWSHGNLLMYTNIATNAFPVTCSKAPKKSHEITKVGINILF